MILSPFVAGSKQPVDCLVLSVDLQDSTPFYAMSDAEASVRAYLNHLIGDLDTILRGGYPEYLGKPTKNQKEPMPAPIAVKFMGDGFLFIWKRSSVKKKALMTLIAHLQAYQHDFKAVNNKALKGEVNKARVPSALRCGMAGGSLRMFKVKGHKSTIEWVGPAINLACRLQAYCKEVKFLMHDLRILNNRDMEVLGQMKVYATQIRGNDGPLLVYLDHTRHRTLGTASAKLFKKIPESR